MPSGSVRRKACCAVLKMQRCGAQQVAGGGVGRCEVQGGRGSATVGVVCMWKVCACGAAANQQPA